MISLSNYLVDTNRAWFKRFIGSSLIIPVCLPWHVQSQEQIQRIEEVIVTAQKREESLQETPISVSAFSQDTLDNKGITDISSLAAQIPSLTVQSNAGVVLINMRGAGNEINSLGADNGVGFHIDGVYIGNAVGSLVDMWDVERVEVLRGPQSTLFGRNTTGGSINIISARPSDEVEAFGDLIYGNYNHLRFRGAVNAPINDRVAVRIAGTREVHDGYTEALQPGIDDINDRDSWFLRGQLSAELGEDLNLLVSLVGSESDDASVAPERIGATYQSSGIPPFAGPVFGLPPGTNPFDALAAPKPADPRKTNTTFQHSSNNETFGVTATLEWNFDDLTLKSISSYYDLGRSTASDFDGSELDFMTVQGVDASEQISQELQLMSNDWDRWEWIIGAYYFSQDAERVTTVTPSFFDAFGGFSTGGKMKTDSLAIFGQATHELTDNLSITGGARFTWDDKSGSELFFVQAPLAPFGQNITGGSPDGSWSEPTGKLSLDWMLDNGNLLYASLSHGYRSGAINITAPLAEPVDPEFVDAFEVGSKNHFFDDRLQFNLAMHYTQYDDQQFTRFLPGGSQVIEAAGKSTAIGIETDFVALPSDNVRIDGSVGWILAEFDKFETSYGRVFGPIHGQSPAAQVDLEGNQLPRTPEWSVALGAQLTRPLTFGELIFRVDFSYRSEIFYDTFNTEVGTEDEFTRVDARVIFNGGDQHWNGEIFVKNIEGKDVTNNRIVNADVPIGFYAPPRVYGIRVGYRF